jgi:hypothetical protein
MGWPEIALMVCEKLGIDASQFEELRLVYRDFAGLDNAGRPQFHNTGGDAPHTGGDLPGELLPWGPPPQISFDDTPRPLPPPPRSLGDKMKTARGLTDDEAAWLDGFIGP